MTTPREHLIHWLRDAYAMEQQALEMCERQSERIRNYPVLAKRIAQHVKETKGQIARLEKCFKRLETSPSMVKNAMGWTAGNMQAVAGMLAPDEIVKGAMASYVFEHMEISAYRILIAAAEAANEPEIAKLCQEILDEEIAMATFLEDHLEDTAVTFLERDVTDQTARI